MSATLEIKMILVGAYAGKTKVLKGLPFVNGEYTLVGSEKEVSGLVNYLGKCYQAYPENSRELAAAQAHCAAAEVKDDGECEVSEDPGDQPADDNLPDDGVRQAGVGPETISSDDGSGSASDAAGPAVPVSDGDGCPDAGIPVAPGSGSPERIRAALEQLDAANDDHWRSDGQPLMEAVQAFYGSADISRAAIVAIYPNFSRATHQPDS